MKRTLVIGDTHGHFDRLIDLLSDQQIVDPDTWQRTNRDVEVVHLGDVGHLGRDGNAAGDLMCWQHADDLFDVILWGNHDRAAISNLHHFHGYLTPRPEITHLMRSLQAAGKLRIAHAVHGHLLTHAGLHADWAEHQPLSDLPWDDPDKLAREICRAERTAPDTGDMSLVWNLIGRSRGGRGSIGGILWHHWGDGQLHDAFPQICGHTSRPEVRRDGQHWCIDIGDATNGQLAGIWLPDLTVVQINRPDWH